MADAVLDIIIFNTPLQTLSLKNLIALGATCKGAATAVDEHFTFLHANYQKWLEGRVGVELDETLPNRQTKCCDKCCARLTLKWNPFTKSTKCRNCYGDLTTLTQAKKDYKLKDSDLECLDYVKRYSHAYRRYVTLFWSTDVIELALVKHKQKSYSKLLTLMTTHVPSKALTKRKEQLSRIFDKLKLTPSSPEAKLKCVDEFITSGEYGVRKLTQMLTVYPKILARWKEVPADVAVELEGGIDTYIALSSTLPSLEEVFEILEEEVTEVRERKEEQAQLLQDQAERRAELEAALAERNLYFRSDSELCKNYVLGTADKSLSEIVQIMENMEFLHKHTNYKHFMSKAMSDAYTNAKDIVRDLYGYVQDPDEYEELISDYVDKIAISQRCQRRAVQEYWRKHKSTVEIPNELVQLFL